MLDLCYTLKIRVLLFFFHLQIFSRSGDTNVLRLIFHTSTWNLRITSVLGDFTGVEATQLKVIVAK